MGRSCGMRNAKSMYALRGQHSRGRSLLIKLSVAPTGR